MAVFVICGRVITIISLFFEFFCGTSASYHSHHHNKATDSDFHVGAFEISLTWCNGLSATTSNTAAKLVPAITVFVFNDTL